MKELILQSLTPDRPFRHRGQLYYLRSPGLDAVGLVREVTMNPIALLRLRPRIERVIECPAPVALSHCLDTAHSPHQIRFVIWLLGRMESQYAIKSVVARASHPDRRVRSEVVRSLRRMRAWHALRAIEVGHWDPQLRVQATPRGPLPFKERLTVYAANCSDRPSIRQESNAMGPGELLMDEAPVTNPSSSSRPLVVSADLEYGRGRPPRSSFLIARVLRRIRKLVRRPVRHRDWRWLLGIGSCFRRTHG